MPASWFSQTGLYQCKRSGFDSWAGQIDHSVQIEQIAGQIEHPLC